MIQKKNGRSTRTYKSAGLVIGIFFLLLGCIIQVSSVQAAAYKIRYGGKTYSYEKALAGATIDGKVINTKTSPGLVINDTCMLSLSDVFKKALKVNYSYNSDTKQVIIKQNDITIKMKLDSKTASVNGKSVTAEEAPKQIKVYSTNKTQIYVPARFVAESLGYSYNWNSSTKASDMKSPFVIKYADEWTVYKGTQGAVTFDGQSINLNGMPSIVLDNTILMRASSVFDTKIGADYKYDKDTKKLTISKNNKTIEMEIDNKEATVNGVSYTMETSPRVVYNKATNKSYVMVPGEFVATNLGYDYSWDKVSSTSRIKTGDIPLFEQEFNVSPSNETSISSVKVYTSNKTEIIEINGTDMLDLFVSDLSDTQVQIVITNAYKDIKLFSQLIEQANYLKGISVDIADNSIIFTIEKSGDCNYYTSESGNTYKIIFGGAGSGESDSGIDDSSLQMKISVPKNLNYDSITTEDLYLKNRFTITLKGDQTAYLGANPIQFDSSIVSDVSYSLVNNNTVITVYTKKLQGYKLSNGEGFVGVRIGNPRDIYDKIVVLDPGHGGSAPGTSKNKIYEKNLNLTILYDLAKEYFNGKDSTIKAYWTRTDDSNPSLGDRAAFAKKVGADVFISLHMNSATPSASGTEVLYASNNKATMQGMDSKKMAALFQDYLTDTLELTGRKIVDRTKLVVLYSNSVPSILIELGFLSNTKDFSKITDPEFQDLAARSIYEATVSMFEMYPTGR